MTWPRVGLAAGDVAISDFVTRDGSAARATVPGKDVIFKFGLYSYALSPFTQNEDIISFHHNKSLGQSSTPLVRTRTISWK